jgi:hypothetical protein
MRGIASFLEEARRQAVLERKVLVVRCRAREGLLELVGPAPARQHRVPATLTLVGCRPEAVRYHPQGSSDGLTLLLRDRGGRDRRLTVGAFTGLARIEALP